MDFSEGQLIQDQKTCPDCRKERVMRGAEILGRVSVKLYFETVGGMRVKREVNGRSVIKAWCPWCEGTFYVKS